MVETPDKIVFFDGVCNLCNGFIDFLILRDSKIMFAPLQGQSAKEMLPPELIEGLTSIVYLQAGRPSVRSTAALQLLTGLGGGWVLMGIFFIVPEWLRNLVYDWIARNRYQWFGQRNSCRLPSLEERARFLS